MLSYKILLSLVAAGGVLSAPAPPHHPNSRGSEVGKRQEAPVPSSVVEPDTILPVGAVSSTTAVVPTVTPVTSVPAENVTSVGPVGDGGPECSLGVIHSGLQKAPASTQKRFVAYWSAYHGTNKGGQFTLPSKTQLDGVTHLILAFVDGAEAGGAGAALDKWQSSSNTNWNAVDPVQAIRDVAGPSAKVMAAFGGWGQDKYYRKECGTSAGRQALADKMVKFIQAHKLDGIDLDWEYPVGNGDDYKVNPNNPCEKYWMVDLAVKIRVGLNALGDEKYLSVAIPGKPGDMLAYDAETVPALEKAVDFWNIMSYDAMNRRDSTSKHHAGAGVIEEAVTAYTQSKMTPALMNIGFPMYAKFFDLSGTSTTCTAAAPLGCSLGEGTFEDATGKDTGKSGAWIFNKDLMDLQWLGTDFWNSALLSRIETSWAAAQAAAVSDPVGMASTAFDAAQSIFWTWLSPDDTRKSCEAWIGKVGGIMMWSVEQDTEGPAGGPHVKALQGCLGAGGNSGNGDAAATITAGATTTDAAATGTAEATTIDAAATTTAEVVTTDAAGPVTSAPLVTPV